MRPLNVGSADAITGTAQISIADTIANEINLLINFFFIFTLRNNLLTCYFFTTKEKSTYPPVALILTPLRLSR